MVGIPGLTSEQNAQLRLLKRLNEIIHANWEETASSNNDIVVTQVLCGINGMIGTMANDGEVHNRTILNGSLFRIYDEVMVLLKQRVEAAIFEAGGAESNPTAIEGWLEQPNEPGMWWFKSFGQMHLEPQETEIVPSLSGLCAKMPSGTFVELSDIHGNWKKIPPKSTP